VFSEALHKAGTGAVDGGAYSLGLGGFIGLVLRVEWPPTVQMLIDIGAIAAGVAALGAMMGAVISFGWHL
jgi:hypothetical protein